MWEPTLTTTCVWRLSTWKCAICHQLSDQIKRISKYKASWETEIDIGNVCFSVCRCEVLFIDCQWSFCHLKGAWKSKFCAVWGCCFELVVPDVLSVDTALIFNQAVQELITTSMKALCSSSLQFKSSEYLGPKCWKTKSVGGERKTERKKEKKEDPRALSSGTQYSAWEF